MFEKILHVKRPVYRINFFYNQILFYRYSFCDKFFMLYFVVRQAKIVLLFSNISLQEISFVTRSQTNSGSLRFYYLDAYEEPAKQPGNILFYMFQINRCLVFSGTVYLFGRIVSEQSKSESCCVILRNIRRRLYFLKRDKVYFLEVDRRISHFVFRMPQQTAMLRMRICWQK